MTNSEGMFQSNHYRMLHIIRSSADVAVRSYRVFKKEVFHARSCYLDPCNLFSARAPRGQVAWISGRRYHHQERARPGVRLRSEGKILSANDAVYELLAFRTDQVLYQSLSRFISPEETREFPAALREVIERGVSRKPRLNPRSASGEVIPTSLNASALRDADGKVIGAIGILRDMRELDKALAYSDSLIK